MSILEIKNLTHSYDDKVLFDKASVAVNNGEHLGIVGLNGAGKTTFINIISKKLLQDEGEVKWLSGIRWGYLDQHADIDRELSVMQYLRSSFAYLYEIENRMNEAYAKMCEPMSDDELDVWVNRAGRYQELLDHADFYDLEAKIKKIAGGLGVHSLGYDTAISTLSGGQRAKVILTKLILEELDIMLLDEPTNFLDVEHIDWLTKYLNGYEKTFLVISHDVAFLNSICKGIINIENGSIKKYSGDYTSYLSQREQNAKQYEDQYIRQQREIEKMETYIAKNKARAATAGMASSRQKMLDKMEVLRKPSVVLDAEFNFPYTPLVTRDALIVKKLEIGYNQVPLLPPFDLHLESTDKVWIRGTNGIGKSTLIKTLTSRLVPVSGKYMFHIAAQIGYLEQDVFFNNPELNPTTYIQEVFPRLNIKEVRSLLARVGLKGELALRPICQMSGGEQVRCRLATLMNSPSNMLILDEPTNHLDIKAKESLLKALQEYGGMLILVSHEQAFAEAICNKTIDIKI